MQKNQADNKDKRLENIGVRCHDTILCSYMHFFHEMNRSALSICNAIHTCLCEWFIVLCHVI